MSFKELAAIRFAKQRLFPPGRVPRTIPFGPWRGIRLVLDLNGQTQYFLGLYEHEVQRWLCRFCKKSRTFIDIGAAEGYYTLFVLKKTAVPKVIAFEPLDESRELLDRNLRLNGLSKSSRLEISTQFVGILNEPGHCSLDSIAETVSFPCTVKMDVEGAELEILRSASRFLKHPGSRWIIETHSLELEGKCAQLLSRAGFTVQIIKNAWWRRFIPEGRPIAHNRWLVAET